MNTISENRGTVLVVNQDPSVLVLLQIILSAADCRVLVAQDSDSAVRLAWQKQIPIDVVLLDVDLPDAKESGLADNIHSIRPEMGVLSMTGFVEDEFVRIKLVDGQADFLPNNDQAGHVVQLVQQLIGGRPAAKRAAAGERHRTFASGAAARGY